MIKYLVHLSKESFKNIFCYPRETIIFSDEENYDTYWSEKRGKNIGNLSTWQQDRADLIVRVLLKNNEPMILADIGCGDGSILKYIHERIPHIQKTIGYDNSDFALHQAKQFGVECHKIDISKKEEYVKFETADYYVLLEVLEHVSNSEFLLLKALSLSKKGLFFSFPNTGYIRHRVRIMFGKFPVQWRILPNEHVRFWTHSDLIWWLKALKIENYKIYCYQGIPFLNRIFPSLFSAGFLVFIQK